MKCDKHETTELTPKEVSLAISKNYRTILRWVKEGKFKNVKICKYCGCSLIPVKDVQDYIQSLKNNF